MVVEVANSICDCGCFTILDTFEAVLGAFLGSAATAGCLLLWLRAKHISSRICCYYTGTLLSKNNFYLLVTHKDELKSDRPENRVVPYTYCDESEQLQAKVRHRKNMGFEFKSFVDYGHLPFSHAKKELEDMGFIEVSRGAGKRQNIAWFLLPNFSISPRSPHRDNIFYPF